VVTDTEAPAVEEKEDMVPAVVDIAVVDMEAVVVDTVMDTAAGRGVMTEEDTEVDVVNEEETEEATGLETGTKGVV